MSINEVFPNPTVKQVIFQIRFPNLLFMEAKIGDVQLEVMREFPESQVVYQRQLVIAGAGAVPKLELPEGAQEQGVTKIWQFRSPKGYQLNIQTGSLDIASEHHKTYSLGSGDRFRDVIEHVLEVFTKVVPIPVVSRLGLRYIDHCPLPVKDRGTLASYYDTAFPLHRFNVEQASEMEFKTVVQKGQYWLRYAEALKATGSDDGHMLVLDFDGFAKDVDPAACIAVTDDLHQIIRDEYARSIKEPVYVHMRQPKE